MKTVEPLIGPQEKAFTGTISVKAILEYHKRDCRILYVDKKKKSRDFDYIENLARKEGVKVFFVKREWLDQYFGTHHGGIVLIASDRQERDVRLSGFNVYLSGVEDPYNLGSACRSLYAFGVQSVVLTPHDWSSQEPTILKASAGAWEKLDILYMNDEELVDLCKRQELPLICASRRDALPLENYRFPQDFMLAIGGALRGLSAIIEQASDQNLFIGYGRDFKNALDTPSAASVFGYAVHLQKDGFQPGQE